MGLRLGFPVLASVGIMFLSLSCLSSDDIQLGDTRETVIRKLGSPIYSAVNADREHCNFGQASVNFASGRVVNFKMLPPANSLPHTVANETESIQRANSIARSMNESRGQEPKGLPAYQWGVAQPFYMSGKIVRGADNGVIVRGGVVRESEHDEQLRLQQELKTLKMREGQTDSSSDDIMNCYRQSSDIVKKMPKSMYGQYFIHGVEKTLASGTEWNGLVYSAGTHQSTSTSGVIVSVPCFALSPEAATSLVTQAKH